MDEKFLLQIVAFGILPAVPLTGYWFFLRKFRPDHPIFPPSLSFPIFALITVIGLPFWSVFLMLLAIAGIYKGEYAGLFGWAVVFATLVRFFAQRNHFSIRRMKIDRWDFLLALGLILIAWQYLGFPTESILGGRDHGVYANYGVYISQHGRFNVLYPYSSEYHLFFKEALPGFPDFFLPGFYLTSPSMKVQFGPLLPVWLAQIYSIFGHDGLFRLNAIVTLLSLGIFYGLSRMIIPKSYAVIATLFLAFNPSEIWLARITLTEHFYQLFILSVLFLILYALENHDKKVACWAGILFGFSLFVRIDSLILIFLFFLSHLLQKIIAEPGENKLSSLWHAFYKSSFPLFALATGYYAWFSTPYLLPPSKPLINNIIAIIASLVALLIVTSKIANFLHKWLTHKTVWVAICILIFSLTVYAYWIRPVLEPHALIQLPGHHLHGTRDYREGSLINLSQYLSPVVIWSGVFGFLISLWKLIRRKENKHLIPLMLAFGGFAVLYLWNPFITPDHFWAIRRFVPVIIPGFVLFATFFISWLGKILPKVWAIGLTTGMVIYLSIFIVRADILIFNFAENKGSFLQLKQIAEQLPENEVILAHGQNVWEWATPLCISFNRRIVPLNLDTYIGKKTFYRWISDRASKQKVIYLLCEDNFLFPGFETTRLSFKLSKSFIEPTVNPLPKKIIEVEKPLIFYQIRGQLNDASYLRTFLGSGKVLGVDELGFYDQEIGGGTPFRWTNGAGKLVVPLDEKHPPKFLKVYLAATGPKGTRFQILINGQTLFHQPLPAGTWAKTFTLSNINLGGLAKIELLSDTFVPKETIEGSTDRRSLGVGVLGLQLLDRIFSPNPLSKEGYRSELEVTNPIKDENLSETSVLNITIKNISKDPWPTFWDLGQDNGSVRLGMQWFSQGPSGEIVAEERTELPQTLFPGESMNIDVPLNPIGKDGKPLTPGDYEVWIGLVQEQVTWFYETGDKVIKLKVASEGKTSKFKLRGQSEEVSYLKTVLGSGKVRGIEESGFHDQEIGGWTPFRWTNGAGKLVVPLDEKHPPKFLKVYLEATGPKGTRFQLLINGQTLFHQPLPAGTWAKTFALSNINLGGLAKIELLSDTFVPKETIEGSTDKRSLGVDVLGLRLLDRIFSPKPLSKEGYRSELKVTNEIKQITVRETSFLNISIKNIGKHVWPTFWDLGQDNGSVRLGMQWFSQGPSGEIVAEGRTELLQTLFPGESMNTDVPLNPIGKDGKPLTPGDYEVWIGLVQEQVTWFYKTGDKVIKLQIKIVK